MCNARQELIVKLPEDILIKAAIIQYKNKKILLKVGYNQKEFINFLSKLNFEYDTGWGCQELFGTVWLQDGTWLERGEYDGSEWWEHRICPDIPKELM